MTREREKPILHGRDHSPGGADPIPGIGGIQFDTYPQAGQWLYVETDGSDTSPSGFGMELFDDSGNGIDISSDGCHVRLNEFGSGDATLLTTAGDAAVTGQNVAIGASASPGDVTVSAHGGTALIRSTTVAFQTSVVQLEVGSAIGLVEMTDAPIFRIAFNGQDFLRIDGGDNTYHILSGATWVADL